LLSAGDSLEAEWSNLNDKPHRYSLNVRLSQDAELEVTVNGEKHVFTAAGDSSMEFCSAEPVSSLSFVCNAGTAQLLSSSRLDGFTISFR